MAARKKQPGDDPAIEAQPGTVPGSEFLPDLSHAGAAIAKPIRCWGGLTADCPVNQINAGGMHFVKLSERIVPNPQHPGKRRRDQRIGDVVFFDPRRFEEFKSKLRRTVIRLHKDTVNLDHGGRNTGQIHERIPPGQLITVPTEAEAQARRANNMSVRPYVASSRDVPAARYMYLVYLEDQERGDTGIDVPPTIEEAGVSIPGIGTVPAVEAESLAS